MDGKDIKLKFKVEDGVTQKLKDMGKATKEVAQQSEVSGSRIKNAFKNLIDGTKAIAQIKNVKKEMDGLSNMAKDVEIKIKTTMDDSGLKSLGSLNGLAGDIVVGESMANAGKVIGQSMGNVSDTMKGVSTTIEDVGDTVGRLGASFSEMSAEMQEMLMGSIQDSKTYQSNIQTIIDAYRGLSNVITQVDGKQGKFLQMDINALEGIGDSVAKSIRYFTQLNERLGNLPGVDSAMTALESLLDLINEMCADGAVHSMRFEIGEIDVEELKSGLNNAIDDTIRNNPIRNIKVSADVEALSNSLNEVAMLSGELEHLQQELTHCENIMKVYSRRNEEMAKSSNVNAEAMAKNKAVLDEKKKQYNELSIQVSQTAQKLEQANQRFNDASKATGKVSSEVDKTTKSFDKLGDSAKKASSSTDKLKSSMGGLTSMIKKIGMLFGLGQLIGFGKDALEVASSLEELENVINVVFGSSADSVNKWCKNTAKAFGLTERQAKQSMGTIGSILSSSGITMDTGYLEEMSQAITQITGDMASFYDKDFETMFAKVRGGLTGEMEGLKELGIVMSVANLEAYRLAQGIQTSYSEMSQADQTMLRYSYIMSETARVQNDFANTQYSYSNSVRNLKMAFEELKSTIGAGLIQALAPVIRVISTVILYVTALIQRLFTLFGLLGGKSKGGGSSSGGGVSIGGSAGGMDNLASSVGGVGDSLDDTTKSAQKAKRAMLGLIGIDQLNLLPNQNDDSSDGGSGGSGGSGGAGGGGIGDLGGGLTLEPPDVSDYLKTIDNLLDEINKGLDKILEPFLKIWDEMSPTVMKHLNELKAQFDSFKQALGNLFKGIWENGGKELMDAIYRLGIALFDVGVIITTTILRAFTDFFNYINPQTNTFTRGFIEALKGLIDNVREFAYALAGAFDTFLSNGGQAFINVMGDIVMLIGTILANALSYVITLITNFMNSWAGHALISATATALDVVAGAIKAVLVVIEKLQPLIMNLATAFAGLYLIKVADDFNKMFDVMATGGSRVELLGTLGGKLADKFETLQIKALYAKDGLKNLLKNGLDVVKTGMTKLKDGLTAVADKMIQFGKSAITSVINGLKTLKTVITHPIQSMKTLATHIWDNIKAMATWVVEMGKKAITAIGSFVSSCVTGIASMLGFNTAVGAGTVALGLLKVALGALGIGLIIGAIVLLVKNFDNICNAIKKIWESAKNIPFIGGFFEKIGEIVGWVFDKISGLWGKVKEFFGWKSEENNIADELEKDEVAVNDLQEEIKATAEVFGTETSNINSYLAGIGFNATKLAQDLEGATALFDEKFGLMSGKAQEYLQAIADCDEEKLAEMSGNSGAYMEEIKGMYADLTEDAKNQFYAKYGHIQGVNDDWLNLESNTYAELQKKHVAYIQNIQNDETLSYQEKERLIQEHEAKITEAWDNRAKSIKDRLAEQLKDESLTQADRYRLQYEADQELRKLDNEKKEWSIENANEVATAQEKAVQAQKDAMAEVEEAQTQSLENVDKALDTTSTNLETFASETEGYVEDIKKAWEGIGKDIVKEFDTLKTDVPNIFANMGKSVTTACTNIANSIKVAFKTMVNSIKSECNNLGNSLKISFNNMGNTMKTQVTSACTTMITTFKNCNSQITAVINQMASGIRGMFDKVKSDINAFATNMTSAFNKIRNDLTNSSNSIKTTVTNAFTSCANTVSNSFNGVNSKLSTQFNSILASARSFAYSMNSALSNIGYGFGSSMAYNFRSAMNSVIASLNYSVISTINRCATITKAGVYAPYIPYLAKGGVVTSPTLAMVGEAGAEAVMPLQNNTGWIDVLASKLSTKMGGGNTHITLELDGKVVTETVVNNVNRQTRLNGISPLR